MNKVTQSIYKKKVDNLEEGGGGGGSTLFLHSIKLPTYNNGYAVMSVVLPFSTPITKDNFQDLLLPYIKVQDGPTTQYPAGGAGYRQVQGSPKEFYVNSVTFSNKNFGTNITLYGVGPNSSNALVTASYAVTGELTDVVKELA